MKKTMLFAAMAAVAMTSCNQNEMEGPEMQGGSQLAEIKIGQTVEGLLTKAAINKGDVVEATIIASPGAAPSDWTTFVPVTENTFGSASDAWNAATFANVAVGSFEAGTNMAVGLNPTLYAKSTEATDLTGATLTGVAPKGTVAQGKVTFPAIDGQQDVMIAQTTAQNKVTFNQGVGSIDPFQLNFEHKTAQLRFRFASLNTTGNGAWVGANIKVKSVTVKKAYLPTAVRLGTPTSEVIWTNTPQSVLLDNFTIAEVLETYNSAGDNKPDFITVDKQALVKPGVGVEVDVVLTVDGKDKSYTAIKPMKDGSALTTVEGMYHNISLTVKQPIVPTGSPEIVATATVTDWGEGDEGEAELK
ncbi:hypothetical protein [Parabacteroides sp.]